MKRGQRVALESAQAADVAVDGAFGAVTGLALDCPNGHARLGGAGDQSGPQAMGSKSLRRDAVKRKPPPQ